MLLREFFQTEELKPQFEKLAMKAAHDIVAAVKSGASIEDVHKMLVSFSHSVESAEGEDPHELDVGGPSSCSGEKK